MCRFIKTVGFALALCVFAAPAHGQAFRMARRPVPGALRPFNTFQFAPNRPFIATGFSPLGMFPVLPAGQTHFMRGNFNSAGAFTPAAFGNFLLSSGGAFQPTNGRFTPAFGGPFILTTREAVNPATGKLTPTPFGGVLVRERGFFAPATNNGFTQNATGSFNAFTGRFQPNGNGNFTLSSPGMFVPTNGTFVPSATGNFVLTSRGRLDPLTGQIVPSARGNFDFVSRGTFVPNQRFANQSGLTAATRAELQTAAVSNPRIGFVSPYLASVLTNQALLTTNQALLTNQALMTTNPYLPAVSSGYGAAYPYYGGGMAYGGGYGGYGGGLGGGYGGGQSNQGGANVALANYAPQQQQARQIGPLDAFGIPTENGAVAWPLAFRLMSPDQKRSLLEPAESSLTAALMQGAAGNANPGIAGEARLDIARLRQWLNARRSDLAEGTYTAANRFLQKLDNALDAIKAG